MPTRRLTIALLGYGLTGLIAAAGCRPEVSLRPSEPPPRADGVAMTPVAQLGKDKIPENYLLLVRLQLAAVQLPIGSVSDSEELWSYVNEEPTGARLGPALARNGLRVGFGRSNDWQDVERILRRLTGRSISQATLLPPPDAPVAWVLKQQQDWQTIFIFRRDRTLLAFEYEPGDNVLLLGASLDYDDPSSVTLSGAPAVRSEARRPRYSNDMGKWALVSEPAVYALPDLAFQFKVPAGGFVIVGPGPEIRRPTSPGHRFLVQVKNGLEHETILVIWPEAFAAPIAHKR